MREERHKKKKRRKLRKKVVRCFFFLLVLSFIILYFSSIKISQIKITGNNILSDLEIIELADIKDYPKIFSVKTYLIPKKLKENPFINSVKVKRNLFGKLSIEINEARLLFYNKNINKLVLSNHKEIEDSNTYLGVPTLINYVPEDIYNSLIDGLSKIDQDVLQMISEIEYAPSKTQDKEVIDSTRFLLRMNDTNTVYMNTINIMQLNKYIDISSAILVQGKETRGILYLDSSTKENFSFESYESKIRAEEEKKKKEEDSDEQSDEQSQLSNQDARDN